MEDLRQLPIFTLFIHEGTFAKPSTFPKLQICNITECKWSPQRWPVATSANTFWENEKKKQSMLCLVVDASRPFCGATMNLSLYSIKCAGHHLCKSESPSEGRKVWHGEFTCTKKRVEVGYGSSTAGKVEKKLGISIPLTALFTSSTDSGSDPVRDSRGDEEPLSTNAPLPGLRNGTRKQTSTMQRCTRLRHANVSSAALSPCFLPSPVALKTSKRP